MHERDSRKYIGAESIEHDLAVLKHRITAAKMDSETSMKFNLSIHAVRTALMRVRKDALDLGIGDRKIVRNTETGKQMMNNQQEWIDIINELSSLNPAVISEARLNRQNYFVPHQQKQQA